MKLFETDIARYVQLHERIKIAGLMGEMYGNRSSEWYLINLAIT